jgi:5-methyltetrahydropteroyltriglutamate--homocysteine methyltransferase
MQRSKDRILTTHVGSLPRPGDLLELIRAKLAGAGVDESAFAATARRAVADVVRKQLACGLDVINDGEMSKPSFMTYVAERLSGFSPDPDAPRESPFAGSREFKAFPEFYAWFSRVMPSPAVRAVRLACTGPVSYRGHARLRADIDNLKAGLNGLNPVEVFVPAISPASIEDFNKNKFYKTTEEYLFALAEAMREEYRAIVDAGFILQIDDPMLATCYVMYSDMSIDQCRKWAELRVEALNHALRGIPREKVRWHTCYGINIGPRVHDLPLKDMIDIFLKVRAGAFSFEAANPRHEHEWRVWQETKLPEEIVLIPGVITHSSVLVEHPELVAERIMRFAGIVGRENVIAGADCGFATFAGSEEIHPSVVWAKFEALAEGARIASKQLWRSAAAA